MFAREKGKAAHFKHLTVPVSISILLILLLSLMPQSAVLADSPGRVEFTIGHNEYNSDGKTFPMDVAPFIENSRTYVPVRFLALSLGVPESNISWNSTKREVTLRKDSLTVVLGIGRSSLSLNGNTIFMDVAPLIRNDRTFLPARYVAEAFGFEVNFDEENKSVNITFPVPKNYKVAIKDFKFSPASISINKGDSITWTNQDPARHTATSSTFDSGSLSMGQSYTYTFNEDGTFEYICSFHPSMKGTVIVK